MTVLGLNHVNIRAPQVELDGIRDFYIDVIGLHMGYRPPFPGYGYWLYAGSQPLVHLHETVAGDQRLKGVGVSLDHFAFTCENRAAVEARLARLGIASTSKSIPGTGLQQIFLHDPAGNRVELQFAETIEA